MDQLTVANSINRNHRRRWNLSFFLLLFTCLAVQRAAPAEYPRLSAILKIGPSFYGSFSMVIDFGGHGISEWDWKTGPMFSAGVQLQTDEHLALQLLAEYSRHHYDFAQSQPVNDPYNSILELTGNLKLCFYPFYLLTGVSISHQEKDDLIYHHILGLDVVVSPGYHGTDAAGNLGIGLEFRTTERISIFVEGTARIRKTGTPVLQGGVSYRIL